MNAQREQSGHTHVEAPGPSEMHDPLVRREMQTADVWFGLAISIAFLVLLAQQILLILGALVITSMLDGGTRLLGRILPIGRGWRLTDIILALFCFLGLTVCLTGSTILAPVSALQESGRVMVRERGC